MIAYIVAVRERTDRRITKVLTVADNPEQAIKNVKGHFRADVMGWDQRSTFYVVFTLNPGETQLI